MRARGVAGYRDQVRRDLDSNAARKVQNEFLEEAKARHEALRRFSDVDALLAFLRDRDADPDVKDAALLALVVEHQRGGRGAYGLVAVVMYPALDHLYKARARGLDDRERDDLWSDVVAAFGEALHGYPVAARPRRVAANIRGDTMAGLRRWRDRDERAERTRGEYGAQAVGLLRDWESGADPEAAAMPAPIGDLAEPGHEEPAPPDAEELRQAERALDAYVAAGVIDEEERWLVLGVHLYGRTLREAAAELGIGREAAKKRHQRALKRLRRAALRKK